MSPASGMGRSEVETCLVNLYYIYIDYRYNLYVCLYEGDFIVSKPKKKNVSLPSEAIIFPTQIYLHMFH